MNPLFASSHASRSPPLLIPLNSAARRRELEEVFETCGRTCTPWETRAAFLRIAHLNTVTTAPLALGLLIYKGLSESIVKAFINLTQLVAGYAVATAATKRLFVFWFIALSYAGRETGVWLWFGWVLTLLWIVAGLACTTLLSIPIIWTINFVASVVAEVVPAEPERLDFAIWVGGLQSVVYVCAKYRPICIMVPLGWSKALFICGAKAPPTVEPARWESIGQPMHHSERRSPHEPNPSAGEVGAPARRG
jgi:hypothetical protein